MKKIFFKSLLLSQFILSSFSFIVAQNFVPLNLGNVWIWENVDWGTIEKSTVVDTNYFFNNNFYSKIRYYDFSNIFGYIRFSYSDNLFYYSSATHPYNNGNIPFYKLNCVVGDTFSYPINQFARFTKEVVDAYQANVFDTIVTLKFINWSAGGLVEGTEVWTDEFGMLYQDVSDGGGVTFLLKGCIINGKAYGDTSYTVGVDDETIEYLNFKLYQNYPNPFNPSTQIKYSIKDAGLVQLRVYDILGKEVANLVNENKDAGYYSVDFDASELPSGVYIYQLQSNSFISSKKMILIK